MANDITNADLNTVALFHHQPSKLATFPKKKSILMTKFKSHQPTHSQNHPVIFINLFKIFHLSF